MPWPQWPAGWPRCLAPSMHQAPEASTATPKGRALAVIVEFDVQGATAEQLYEVERLTVVRGEAAGAPPYAGCMFLAVTATDDGFRFVSAWRSTDDFHAVMEKMLGPDLASVGLAASAIKISPAISMAIPPAH